MSELARSRDWSSKHTRLRYQSVLSGILFVLICTFPVTDFKVPGFFEFQGTPPYYVLWFGVFMFYIFSLISFFYQTAIEENTLLISGSNPSELIDPHIQNITDDLLSGAPSFSLDEDAALREALNNALQSDHEKSDISFMIVFLDQARSWIESAGEQVRIIDAKLEASLPELIILSGKNFSLVRILRITFGELKGAFEKLEERTSTLLSRVNELSPSSGNLLTDVVISTTHRDIFKFATKADLLLSNIETDLHIAEETWKQVIASTNKNFSQVSQTHKLFGFFIPISVSAVLGLLALIATVYNIKVGLASP